MDYREAYQEALAVYGKPQPSKDATAFCDMLCKIVKILSQYDISGANIIRLAESDHADVMHSEDRPKVLVITYCWDDISDPRGCECEAVEVPMSIISSPDPIAAAEALMKEQRISELKEKILRTSDGVKRMGNSLDDLQEELATIINQ